MINTGKYVKKASLQIVSDLIFILNNIEEQEITSITTEKIGFCCHKNIAIWKRRFCDDTIK